MREKRCKSQVPLSSEGNGMLDDDAIMARTVQLKPLPESAPPMDRYRLTSVKVLGKGLRSIAMWLWGSKPMGSHFGVGEFTANFRTPWPCMDPSIYCAGVFPLKRAQGVPTKTRRGEESIHTHAHACPYTSRLFCPVSFLAGEEAMEELPTWDQKRLMVYPCHDGYALQGGTCVPCEAGSILAAKNETRESDSHFTASFRECGSTDPRG